MKEITVLSGKGGTGKTSITAALAAVASNAVFCDNDVDASDLHLLLNPAVKQQNVFVSGTVAHLNADKCTRCGICYKYCRFDAIHRKEEGGFAINPFQCEGCKLCERVCPVMAIQMKEQSDNEWFISETRFGPLVHAQMGPGEENSGKLVSLIRSRAKELASDSGAHFVLNDGPPGIGCTAISALSGTQRVLLVIEPSYSSLHDVKRLVQLVRSFDIEMFAVINKCDIDDILSLKIESYLESVEIPLLEKLPFDKKMVEAMSAGQTIVEFLPDSDLSKKIYRIWEKLSY